MADGRAATDSADEKKQLGCKEYMIIDISPAKEPGQWPKCCIYRVPKLLRSVKPEAYTPKLVHIGPLHYDMEQPKDIEIQKLRYLKEFCERTNKSQNDLAGIIQSDKLKIRHCYSETFDHIMALEQCHYPMEAQFCNYIILLDYIIDNEKDIELLVEKKIIVNMLGSNIAAATFINKLCLQIVTSGRSCYDEEIKGLQSHYDDHWSRIMATMARVYFGDFWGGAATVI